MMGINVDNLNSLIKKTNLYLDSFNQNYNKLVSNINGLNSDYSGSSLNYLFSVPTNEIKNIRTISNVVNNYSNVLSNVKFSYQKQDSTFKEQINRINSNL